MGVQTQGEEAVNWGRDYECELRYLPKKKQNSYTIVPAPLGIEPNTIKYLRKHLSCNLIAFILFL